MRALAAAGVPSEPKPYHSEAPSWEWFRSREQRSHSDRMWLRVRFDLVGGLTLQWAKTSTAYFGLAEDGLLAVDDGGEMALPARFVALARGIALAEGDLDACSHEARP